MSGLPIDFAAAMDRLAPFEPHPALAVAVSGGADSTALAILTRDWVRPRGGSVLGLVVDHGLRPTSADEARLTIQRLAQLDIPAQLLPLANLTRGPALAERARAMRYDALIQACREASILHLLLGHHAADQIETLVMRVLRGSRTHGLACMTAIRETATLRLLRPLLTIEPVQLRRWLTANGTAWIEDPSNTDIRALRPRLRQQLAGPRPGDNGLRQAISAVGRLRTQQEAATAAELAQRATIRPEGFAVLSPGRIGAFALSRLIQTVGGAPYPPNPEQIDDLAMHPRPATLAGVRIMPAGRLADGMLILREPAATLPPVPARRNAIWDRRFRLTACPDLPETAEIGRLGQDAARFRHHSDLPSVILQTLPAIRIEGRLAAVPHLGYTASPAGATVTVLFAPSQPAAGACFVPPTEGF
jgi:tRNA(Ile)-lysidine synthase